MPEGHTIHRLAEDHLDRFGGTAVRVTSPQGKFSDSAALLDGGVFADVDAHGKHLFLGFGEDVGWVHIHLGLFGKVGFGDAPAPPPTDTVRLRIASATAYMDLRGPTTCALITAPEKRAIHDRLGPDPLRPADDGEKAWARISRSRTTVAALLMDQKVIMRRRQRLSRGGPLPARHRPVPRGQGRHPPRVGRDLGGSGGPDARGCTEQPHRHRPARTHPRGDEPPPRVDDHGGEVYVYRRARLTCHLCATEIRTAPSPPAISSGAPPASDAEQTGRELNRRAGS